MGYFSDCRQFFAEFRRQNRNTGSILPSSRFLAQALTRPLSLQAGPRQILEIGPGTGAVTDAILRQLRPGDHLDIVEINPNFVAILQQRFEKDPNWKSVVGQTKLINAPLQDVSGIHQYDFIISGLPLNNFSLSLVREIFDCYQRLLKTTGTLSYFEYLAIRRLKSPFVWGTKRRKLNVLDRFLKRRIARHQIGAEKVFRNFPPAIARHFRFAETAAGTPEKA